MKNWYEIQDKKYTEKVWILAFFNTKHECHGFAEGDKDPIFYYENSLSLITPFPRRSVCKLLWLSIKDVNVQHLVVYLRHQSYTLWKFWSSWNTRQKIHWKVWILAFFNTKHECHGFAEGDKDPIFYYENSQVKVI
jgi:hypothetical protein